MIVKRYYAPTMSEAMATIRTELGPDAVILSSKPVRKKGLLGIFQKKDMEVIAAYEPRLESPKTREEREATAYAAALRAAKQEKEQAKPISPIPPAPGAAMGSNGTRRDTPPVTAAGRAANAYRSAAGVEGSQRPAHGARADGLALAAQAVEARPLASQQENAPHKDANAIQQALAAAIAVREAEMAGGRENIAPDIAQGASEEGQRVEAMRRERESFVPYTPPEMVINQPEAPEETAQMDVAPPDPAVPDRLDMLERRLSAVADMIGAVAERMGEGELPLSEEGREVYKLLSEGDVEERLAKALAKEAQELAPRIGGTAKEAARRLLLRELRESAPLAFASGKRTVLVFMGPTGVGKTTTLVKLATMCAVRGGLKVGMINTDTYRIAAQEQLKIYSDILGVPQSVVYAPGEMAQALGSMEDREVIFVDTAGKRPGDRQHREDMAQLMEAIGGEARALLCVAAPTGPRALREVIEHYSFLDDYGLILTKTDEVAGAGAAINSCAFSGKNLHYLTAGQSVPDDIEEVDAYAIAGRLLS